MTPPDSGESGVGGGGKRGGGVDVLRRIKTLVKSIRYESESPRESESETETEST